MNRTLLVVGQSHVAAFRAAAKTRRERDPAMPRTRVIHTLEDRYRPEITGDGTDARFAAPLTEALRDQMERHQPLLVSVMGGNFHNSLSLIRHERPFDFHLSGEESPPLDAAAEPVPEALVAAALRNGLAHDLTRLRLLAKAGPFIHVESPPPLADDAAIAAQAETYFRRRGLAMRGVSPAGLRWRIWRLSNRILRAEVERLGNRFLPVPATLCDERGFLHPRYAHDATHGNEAYGEAMIAKLETT